MACCCLAPPGQILPTPPDTHHCSPPSARSPPDPLTCRSHLEGRAYHDLLLGLLGSLLGSLSGSLGLGLGRPQLRLHLRLLLPELHLHGRLHLQVRLPHTPTVCCR